MHREPLGRILATKITLFLLENFRGSARNTQNMTMPFLSPTLHCKLQEMWTFHKLKDMHWNFQPCYLNTTKDMDYANIFNLWEMLNLVSHCSILCCLDNSDEWLSCKIFSRNLQKVFVKNCTKYLSRLQKNICSILLLGHFWWAITQPNCWCLSYPANNFWQRKPYGFVQSEEIW